MSMSPTPPQLTRRHALALTGTAALSLPARAWAGFREITWDDLIPPGIPYSEIIGEGEMDVERDIWKPIYDANATKFNTDLNGQDIKMPGYILPLETTAAGVREFVLVPYIGACIHTPPPPPNQLVFVTADPPWPSEDMWEAIWVYGRLQAKMHSTELAEIGYQLTASKIEVYEW